MDDVELEFTKCLEEIMEILEKYKPKLYDKHPGFKWLYNTIQWSIKTSKTFLEI